MLGWPTWALPRTPILPFPPTHPVRTAPRSRRRRWEEVRELGEMAGIESTCRARLSLRAAGWQYHTAPRARGVVHTPPVPVDGTVCGHATHTPPVPVDGTVCLATTTERAGSAAPVACNVVHAPQRRRKPPPARVISPAIGGPAAQSGATGWRQRDAKRRRRLARRWVVAPPCTWGPVAPCQSRVGGRC